MYFLRLQKRLFPRTSTQDKIIYRSVIMLLSKIQMLCNVLIFNRFYTIALITSLLTDSKLSVNEFGDNVLWGILCNALIV